MKTYIHVENKFSFTVALESAAHSPTTTMASSAQSGEDQQLSENYWQSKRSPWNKKTPLFDPLFETTKLSLFPSRPLYQTTQQDIRWVMRAA